MSNVVDLQVVCHATSKTTGERCAQPAIPGGKVCRFHGGSAPQVRAAAAERIAEARDSALDRLIERLQPGAVDALGLPIEHATKDLVEAVTKLTDKHQLLTGQATSRDESLRTARLELETKFANLGPRVQSVLDSIDRPLPDEEGFIVVEGEEVVHLGERG